MLILTHMDLMDTLYTVSSQF